jgi:branched-chain amino acid transport system ATP-binding protein
VSIHVAQGDAVAVLGRNGVGKTTMINALLGIARVSSGSISIRDRSIVRPRRYTAARSGVAIVLQGRGIISNLTVAENLLLGSAVNRRGPWTKKRILQLFPVLEERSDAPGTALSGGQQQMLAIGRALMANPDLLVLDEPSEGLAPIIVDELATVFRSLRTQGTSILLVEQNLKLVERVTESFHVLEKGRVIATGRTSDTPRDALRKFITV